MNNMGDLVNLGGFFNLSFGGMDGGIGGCRCEYINFVGVNGLRFVDWGEGGSWL